MVRIVAGVVVPPAMGNRQKRRTDALTLSSTRLIIAVCAILGVLVPYRVRLLLGENTSCYRQRRDGERRRKSVRGCIVGPDMQALHLIVVKQGEQDIPGLTDAESVVPKRLGPKRANHIRKFFNLSKKDDVRDFVVRREVQSKTEGKGPYTKAPKIQRLITSQRLQRKRHLRSLKVRKSEQQRAQKEEYLKLIAKRQADSKAERSARKAERDVRRNKSTNVAAARS